MSTLKGKGNPYSITERGIPKLIPVFGSQPAGDVSHKPGGRLLILSSRPAIILATLKRVATNFAAWWTEARWVWTVCLRLLPDSVAAAIWTQAPSAPESSTLTTRLHYCLVNKMIGSTSSEYFLLSELITSFSAWMQSNVIGMSVCLHLCLY